MVSEDYTLQLETLAYMSTEAAFVEQNQNIDNKGF